MAAASTWRFIPFKRYDPYIKTALNDVGISRVQGTSDPIVWLAGWNRNCINVGYTQQVAAEVDVEKAADEDVPIVRRQGAGGTMYLTRDGEVTWGLIASEGKLPDDLNDIYEQVCGRIVDALDRLGIDARYEPVNDVVTNNGKLSGATARTSHGVVYVGGTLLYSVDPDEMFTFLTSDTDKLDDKPVDVFTKRVSSVSQESDAAFDEVQDALKAAFLDGKDVYKQPWTDDEMRSANALAKKYRNDAWIFRNGDERDSGGKAESGAVL
jgi:lipoate-protein ligase A